MVYTEIRKINGKKYYYRVLSVRQKDKISKRRIYLGSNLSRSEILGKERAADKELLSRRADRISKDIEGIRRKIVDLLKKNSVNRAGIFGSYSRGEQNKNSDVDILIKIENPNMSLLDFARLIRLLEGRLGKKVDLVEYDAIKPRIKENILKEEIRII